MRAKYVLLGLAAAGAAVGILYYLARRRLAPTVPATPTEPTAPTVPTVPTVPVTPATRRLVFKAAKYPGAGRATNNIRIETDKGIITRVESGRAPYAEGQVPYAEISVDIPADASWVSIINEDGSALMIQKYPTVDGKPLTTIIEKFGYFRDGTMYDPNAWVTDGLKFSLV